MLKWVDSKNIFIVCCEHQMFKDKFSKRKNCVIINYKEVIDKLTNDDVMNIPPTQDLIDFYIIKRINEFKLSKREEFLYVWNDKISNEYISYIINKFNHSHVTSYFHLLITTENDSIDKSKFNTIQFLNK